MPTLKNLQGEIFGRLLVIERAENVRGRTAYRCLCECGNPAIVLSWLLTSEKTQSCGCWRRDNGVTQGKRRATHGLADSPTYKTWRSMLARCHNPKSASYPRYGGRGITVCDRWMQFENFVTDLGERPDEKSLDRIDPNGGYTPTNCRWATAVEQANNRRSNCFIEHNGQRKTLSQWSRETGIKADTIKARLTAGMSVQQALTQPVREQTAC